MQFLVTYLALVLLAATTIECHSGVYCVKWVSGTCRGWPRNDVYKDDWIQQSNTNYMWDGRDGRTCPPSARVMGQEAPGAPMAEAEPGEVITTRFYGNGHSRWDIGSPQHFDPGLVRIHWNGTKETEILYVSDLSEANWIRGSQANYSANADIVINYQNNPPTMEEKANYLTWTVPENTPDGLHVMYWVWLWTRSILGQGKDIAQENPHVYSRNWKVSYISCFEVRIKNSKFTGVKSPDILGNKPGYNDKETENKYLNEECSKTCLRGGSPTNTCTGQHCPPCWYLIEGNVHCYDLVDNKCPFPAYTRCDGRSKAVTLELSNTYHSSPSQPSQPEVKDSPSAKPPQTVPSQSTSNISPNKPQGPQPAPVSDSRCTNDCYRGGMPSALCSGYYCPPCRYNRPGKDSCFEFIVNTKECPFPNPLAVCKAGKKTTSVSVQSTESTGGSSATCTGTCYPGGILTAPKSGGIYPPCWYQQPKGDYYCYEFKPGTSDCPFPNPTAICGADIKYKLSKRHLIHRRRN